MPVDHDAAVVDRYLRALQAGEAAPKGRYGELELQFLMCAGAFSERNGISYAAWRDVGVPYRVLARAGLSDCAVTCSRSSRSARAAEHGLRVARHSRRVAGCGDDR